MTWLCLSRALASARRLAAFRRAVDVVQASFAGSQAKAVVDLPRRLALTSQISNSRLSRASPGHRHVEADRNRHPARHLVSSAKHRRLSRQYLSPSASAVLLPECWGNESCAGDLQKTIADQVVTRLYNRRSFNCLRACVSPTSR